MTWRQTLVENIDEDPVRYLDRPFLQDVDTDVELLLVRIRGLDRPKSGRAVPIAVAADGKTALAAYLRLGNGYLNSRQYVVHELDVTPDTVSSYCNMIRWTPK